MVIQCCNSDLKDQMMRNKVFQVMMIQLFKMKKENIHKINLCILMLDMMILALLSFNYPSKAILKIVAHIKFYLVTPQQPRLFTQLTQILPVLFSNIQFLMLLLESFIDYLLSQEETSISWVG